MEQNNVGTMTYKGESPKQGLTCTKDLTIELTEGCKSSYRRSDKLYETTFTIDI